VTLRSLFAETFLKGASTRKAAEEKIDAAAVVVVVAAVAVASCFFRMRQPTTSLSLVEAKSEERRQYLTTKSHQ
jgi:hypothetical protein